MERFMGRWLAGEGTLVQPGVGKGRTRLSLTRPSAKIADGNSLSRHGHTHHSSPGYPLYSGPKKCLLSILSPYWTAQILAPCSTTSPNFPIQIYPR